MSAQLGAAVDVAAGSAMSTLAVARDSSQPTGAETARNAPELTDEPDPRGLLHRVEDGVLAITLFAMIALPLGEAFVRRVFHTGIPGSAAVVQHLTLLIGVLGAAVASREGRLLSLSSAGFLRGWARGAAALFSGTVASSVAVLLAVAAWGFVLSQRAAGALLVYGIPQWVVLLVLPAGFVAVAVRLWWRSSASTAARAAALVAVISVCALAAHPPVSPAHLRLPALALLLAATVLGAPLFAALGGAALVLFWTAGSPIASLALDHYTLITNPSLPTIPLFTLAGYLLSEGGASTRLLGVFRSLFGSFRGGPAIVTVLVCAFFTAFTGASGITILALGGLLLPVLTGAGYSERVSLGLVTGSGSIGLLFPPSLPVILYAIVAGVSMQEMFLGGLIPGLVMLVMVALWGVLRGPKRTTVEPFDLRTALRAILAAKWELLLPVVALVALLGGLTTPVEAAALTAACALLFEAVIHRDLKGIRRVASIAAECGLLVGGVLLILGVALGFTNFLVDAEVPALAVDWAKSSIRSPFAFLLVLNLFLLVVGCLMDIFSAIVVVVPLIVPIGAAFGIDPIHLGIVFLTNLEIGFLTPPIGMNLFLSSYRFGKPISEVCRAALPLLAALGIALVVITYVPALTTFLPRLAGHGVAR